MGRFSGQRRIGRATAAAAIRWRRPVAPTPPRRSASLDAAVGSSRDRCSPSEAGEIPALSRNGDASSPGGRARTPGLRRRPVLGGRAARSDTPSV